MDFKKAKEEDVIKFYPYFTKQKNRIFDHTVIGAFMWGEFFQQEYAIEGDALILKYRIHDDIVAFNLPSCAKCNKKETLASIKRYVNEFGYKLIFKEVTDYGLKEIASVVTNYTTTTNRDWYEYVYSAKDLSTLVGKKFNKKRNHVNKFYRENMEGSYNFIEINEDNVEKVIEFHDIFAKDNKKEGVIAETEAAKSRRVLERFSLFKDMPVVGMYLEVNNRVVGYTIGEVIDNTLFTHIEKALRDVNGAYNVINQEFAKLVLTKYPQVEFINRSDDAGDLGLRFAKLSYNPVSLIPKYIVTIE